MKKSELAERLDLIEKHLGIENKQVELVVGNWYKRPKYGESIFFLKEITDSWLKGFGINYHKKWTDDFKVSNNELETYVLAAPEEVRSALVAEAKRRGYKAFYCPEGFYFDGSLNVLYDRMGHDREVVLSNGQWATIAPEKTAVKNLKFQVKCNSKFEILEMKKFFKKEDSSHAMASFPVYIKDDEISFQTQCDTPICGYTIIDYADFARENGLALKPTSIDFKTNFGIKSTILDNEVLLDCGCGALSLTDKDIEAIHSAMQSLK